MRYDLLHPKALRRAVIEHLGTDVDVPQERQFRRWVTGDTPVPGWARRVINEVMQAPPQQEAAPPDWAERLMAGVFALEAKAEISPDELAEAQARVAAYLAVARRTRPRQADDGATGGASA